MAKFLMYQNHVLIDQVILKNPDLGDTDSLNFTRINRVTLGNQLVVYSDGIWPTFERLKLPFSYLSQTDAYNLKRFVHQWFGINCYYLDYENRYWFGFFTSPEISLEEADKLNFKVSIDFEGWPSAGPT